MSKKKRKTKIASAASRKKNLKNPQSFGAARKIKAKMMTHKLYNK